MGRVIHAPPKLGDFRAARSNRTNHGGSFGMASTGDRKATREKRRVSTYRATDAEERQIAACAERAGMPRSTWIREAATRPLPHLAKGDRQRLERLGDDLRTIGIEFNLLVRLAHRGDIRSSRNFEEVLGRLTAKLAEHRETLDSVRWKTEDS